jgi:hypothetical protein
MDYDALFAEQEGRCFLCEEEWTPINPKTGKKRRRWHRDHDRVRMIPRGLLCYRCNAAVRTYMTLKWARNLVRYFEKYEPKE